jgi:hypothetical protein
MRQVLNQAPPRAHSREIQLPWEIAKPALAAQDRVLVTMDLQETIQDPAQRNAFLTRIRDESWEITAERALPSKGNVDIMSKYTGQERGDNVTADISEDMIQRRARTLSE